MDKLERYREIIEQVLLDYAKDKPSYGEIRTETIIDDEKGHYELMHVGWLDYRRIHGVVIHIDIIGDKVWIEHDGTSPGVALDLVDAGIPRSDIVLGFRPPEVRPYTDFAVA